MTDRAPTRLGSILFAAALVAGAASACDIVVGINGDYTVAQDTSSASTGMAPPECSQVYEGPRGVGGAFDEGCPTGMVRIVDGRVSNNDAAPFRPVAPFCIQDREVTFAAYLSVVEERERCFTNPVLGECRPNDPFSGLTKAAFSDADPNAPAHPLDYCDADAYCRSVGLRLCTFDEWRSACSTDGAELPWVEERPGTPCVQPPDVLPLTEDGASCNGDAAPREHLWDMVGNVAEIVAGFVDFDTGQDRAAFGANPNVPALDGGSSFQKCYRKTPVPFHDVKDLDPDPGIEQLLTLEKDARIGARCCADVQ